jgi:adenosylcobinamide-GDP ribazoletransferase
VTALREHLNLFALALHRATVLRVGVPPEEEDDEALRASDAHLPGAGWVVGICACLVFAVVGLMLRATAWGALVAAVAATVATTALTRGRAETALFRLTEHLQPPGAAVPSGAGTLVLLLVIAAKLALLAALASLSEPALIAILFASQVVSRLAPLLLARALDGDVPPRAVYVGALWCLIPVAALVIATGLTGAALALGAAATACYSLWRLGRRQAEPADRDLLACAQLPCEVAFLFGAAIGL